MCEVTSPKQIYVIKISLIDLFHIGCIALTLAERNRKHFDYKQSVFSLGRKIGSE